MRLPKVKELCTIVDRSKYNPSIDTTYFPGTRSADYWPSGSLFRTSNSWKVHFGGGSVDSLSKTSSYTVCAAFEVGSELVIRVLVI